MKPVCSFSMHWAEQHERDLNGWWEENLKSVSNSSTHQSNALINVLSNWNQVMEQSYPVQPTQGLISTEAQWINDSISMHVCVHVCVCVETAYFFDKDLYVSAPTGLRLFLGWIITLFELHRMLKCWDRN